MKVKDIGMLMGMDIVHMPNPEQVLLEGYTSDLLSDVMARAPQDSVLITIQAHRNTIAVGALAGVRAVILCNRREIPDDMLDMAREEDIAVFRTRDHQFKVSVRIAERLRERPADDAV